jgi:hypothetical protein
MRRISPSERRTADRGHAADLIVTAKALKPDKSDPMGHGGSKVLLIAS